MLTRLVLRVLSLGAKFALTLAIAQALGYAAVAQYGIAVAAAVIGTKVLGLGFSAECNRRLASIPAVAVCEIKRLAWVHVGCYATLAMVAMLLWQQGMGQWQESISGMTALAIGAVVIAEHQAFEVNGYLFALHRSGAASWLLFVRTGLWAALGIAGLAGGVITSMMAVLLLWIAADLFVIACGWRLISRTATPIRCDVSDTSGTLLQIWRAGSSFYLAAILLSISQYTERFVGAGMIGAEELGRYVFLWAIANAVQTLSQAAVATTAAPALARAAHESPHLVSALMKRQLLMASGLALATAAGLWCFLGEILALAGGVDDTTSRVVFALLLVSFVLRAIGDIEWAAAIALALRRQTLAGMALVALAGIPVAWVSIRMGGMAGAALAHVTLSLAMVGWLAFVLRRRLAGESASLLTAGGEAPCR